MSLYIIGLEDIDLFVQEVLESLQNGVVILKGDLAAGKTTLVKAIVNKLGIKDDVTSPTFSLQHCYGDRVYHYDVYNHGLEHFISLGMLEELDKPGLHFIEWGNDELIKILSSAGIECLVVEIEKISDTQRKYELQKR